MKYTKHAKRSSSTHIQIVWHSDGASERMFILKKISRRRQKHEKNTQHAKRKLSTYMLDELGW